MNWQYRHTVLGLCTLAFASTMLARLVISPVVPDVTDGFGVSTGAVGLALSGMWAAYALTQFPSGILGDRFGERRVILAAVGITGCASLLLSLSPNFVAFAILTVALGAGAGLHYSVATTLLTKEFDDIGRAIGLHVAGGPLAGLIAPVVATAVAARYDWRAAIAVGAAVAVPVFVAFGWRIEPTPPERPDESMRDRMAIRPLVALLSRPPITFTTAVAVLGAFCWQATASFLPTFLVSFRGLPETSAGLLFSAYFVVNGLVQPTTGWVSDRIGRDGAAIATMALGVVGYTLLVAGPELALLPAVVCVGAAMTWGAPLQSRFFDKFEADERGAAFGLVRTAYMVLGATGSVVVGVLSDVAGWEVAYGLLVGVTGLGLALLLGNRVFRLGL
ncbi:MFS transporter [Haloplanus aerogenes]|uniref:MFS transporter n=1 Tax=Haloplanus aerogenes TaxID=660522 RepID=A0A3M0DE50_9EURY|nr:MFS transporter [Haloplanus aerogenes]AZH25067.1 MFS transporter [Haloplanus aerogenes]RMB13713.1 putative MFS family arabinose efflux permease [Haloplanus aerogenes]